MTRYRPRNRDRLNETCAAVCRRGGGGGAGPTVGIPPLFGVLHTRPRLVECSRQRSGTYRLEVGAPSRVVRLIGTTVTGDGRRETEDEETEDERRKTRDGRRETGDEDGRRLLVYVTE